MLTADLAIAGYERSGRIYLVRPDRLCRDRHGQYPALAERMLELYSQGAGLPRRILHARVHELFADADDCEPRRIRAFCKLLDEASTYDTDAAGAASELRLEVFARAAAHHPLVAEKLLVFDHPVDEVRDQIAREIGRPWPDIESRLYRDVIAEQPLLAFEGYQSPVALLSRYNLAQVQAALYRAELFTIRATTDFKVILRAAKLAGLLHDITQIDDEAYRIDLTGPASLMRETRRYGVAMAAFLPSLVACAGCQAQARMKTPWNAPAVLDLSADDKLGRDLPAPAAFDSEVEARFARKFAGSRNGWQLVREARILSQGQTVFLPDFLLRHEDGTEVHLEIVGFWTPEYLAKKRETVRRFRAHRLLLAVAERCLRPGAALPPDVVGYKTAIRIPPLIEAAERLRLQARAPAAAGGAPAVTLRDYQEQCLEAILAAYKRGVRRQLVCLPTGTGKTVIFSEFPRFLKMKKRMLVIAHRAELLDQARDKIRRTAPHLCVEIDQAGRKASGQADVVVASVPTLGREGSRRLGRLNPEDFYLIVVDEAHHATATTYRRVLEHFDAFADDTQRLVVGFTATPKRGDGLGLNMVFEEIVYARSLPEMIEAGHLAPVCGYRVETAVDLSEVRSRMGDFVASQLARSVNVGERNALVIDVFRKHLAERKSICFCVDVAHARALAAGFADAGIPAAAVYGSMPQDLRLQILDSFRKGEIRVLANCMVLTEGFDEPSVEGIILARPTRSTLLYTQMIGRGTRLHPGKEAVTVIDIVDLTREHKLVTLPSLFGLSDSFDLEGRSTAAAREALEWVEKNRPWVDVEAAMSLSDLRYRCTRIDLIDLQTPAELTGISTFAWARQGRGQFRLGLPDSEAMIVASTILNEWEVVRRKGNRQETLQTCRTVRDAIAWAEACIQKERRDLLPLVSRDTRWRHEPASEKQRALLRKNRLSVPPGLTKGQASHVIGMLIGKGEE